MAEQREVITLEIDDAKAILAARRTNAELEKAEKSAGAAVGSFGRVVDSVGSGITKTTDKSLSSIERLVRAAENRAASAGRSAVQNLTSERDSLISRVAGDERAVARVRSAFDTLISKQKEVAISAEGIASAISNPLQAAGTAVSGFAAKFGVLGVVAAGVGAGLAVVGSTLFGMVSEVAKAAEGTLNLADRLGITAREAAVLEGAAKIAGVGVESFTGVVRKLSDTLSESTTESRASIKALDDMGIRVVDSSGKFRNSIDIFRDFSANISKIPDHARQVALATQLFGRGAADLLPLIKNFADLEAQSRATGQGMDENLIKRMAAVDDKLDRLGLTWDRIKLKFAEGIVGTVEIVQRVLNPLDQTEEQKKALEKFSGAAVHGGQVVAPSTSRIPESLLRFGANAEGDELVEQFRKRQTGLKDQLAALEKQRAQAEALIQKGASKDVQQKNIAAFNALDKQVEALKAKIKAIEEAPAKLAAAHQAAANALESAVQSQLGPLDKIIAKYNQLREATKADPKAAGILNQAQFIESQAVVAEQRAKADDAAQKTTDLIKKGRLEMDQVLIREEEERAQQSIGLFSGLQDQVLAMQTERIESAHEAELRGLQSIHATTVSDKIQLEQQKAEIETNYLQQSSKLKLDILEAEHQSELAGAEGNAVKKLAIDLKYKLKAQALKEGTNAAIAAATENAAINSARIVTDENQRIFDSLKKQTEDVVDAMIGVFQNGWSSMGNFLKATLLGAMKDVIGSQVAKMLMGGAAGSTRPTGPSLLGSLFGLSGVAMGSTSARTPGIVAGGIPGMPNPFQIPGLSGPSSTSTSSGGGPIAANAGIVGNLKEQYDQYKSMLNKLGGLYKGHGVGGVAGGAMLAGGGILAIDGIRRGGVKGLLETTAGGALIGAKFGGPIGALIGAGIGAGVGMIGLFRKGAEQKIVDKIKSTYGVTIPKSLAKDPMLGIIKQNFGGNIDMGIRSPQIRELIELYAMSSGQNSSGIVSRIQSASFANMGGQLTQMPTYQNGAQIFAGGNASSSTATAVTVKLDGPATTALLQGEAVSAISNSPRQVARANTVGQQQSVGRRTVLAGALKPNFGIS